MLLSDCDFPTLLCFLGTSGSNPVIYDSIKPLLERYPGGLVIMAISVEPEVTQRFEAIGRLVFEEPARALTALAALAGFGRSFTQESVATTPSACPRLPAGRLNEQAAKQVLAACGVACPREKLPRRPRRRERRRPGSAFPSA
ncbi:MAG: hypothetical protein ABI224_13030 [Acetobacteraceae bacterium]